MSLEVYCFIVPGSFQNIIKALCFLSGVHIVVWHFKDMFFRIQCYLKSARLILRTFKHYKLENSIICGKIKGSALRIKREMCAINIPLFWSVISISPSFPPLFLKSENQPVPIQNQRSLSSHESWKFMVKSTVQNTINWIIYGFLSSQDHKESFLNKP